MGHCQKQMEGNTLNENISKKSFPTVVKGAVDQITLSTVVNGFRKSGIYPLDPGKVDYSKCVRDHLQQECEEAELSSPVSDPAVFRMRCGLRFLEERIGYTKLQLFESAYGGEWQGDIEDTSLYLLWSSLKRLQKHQWMMVPQVEEVMVPQVEEMVISQLEEMMLMMIPQVEDIMIPQVEEMTISQLEEMMIPQVEEMMLMMALRWRR